MSSSLQKAVEDANPPEKLPSLQKAVEESKAPQVKPGSHDKDVPSLQKAVKKTKAPPAKTSVDASQKKDVPSLQKAANESKAPQSKTNSNDGHDKVVPSLQRALDASQHDNDDGSKLDSSSRHKRINSKPAAPAPADKLSASVNRSMQGSRYRPSGGRRPLGTTVRELSQRFGSIRENNDDMSFSTSENFPIQATTKVRTTRKELETLNATQLARIQELEAKMQQQKEELKGLQQSKSKENQASNQEETVTKLKAQNAQLAAELKGSKEDVQRLQSSVDKGNQKGNSQEATIAEQKKQIDTLRKQIEEQSKKLERADQQATNLESTHKKQQQRIEELELEAAPLRESKKAQDERIKGLEETLLRLQSMSEDASMKENGLEKVIQEQQAKLDALQKEKLEQATISSQKKDELNRELSEANRQLTEWKAAHKKQQQKLEDLESQATPLQEQAKDLEETAKRLEAQNQTRLERIQSLEAENFQIKQRLQEKEGEAKRLQSSLDEQSLKGTSLETTINEQKKQISSLKKDSQERTAAHQAVTDELKQKLERSQEKVNRLQLSVGDVSVKEHSLEKTIEEREAQIDSMREEMLAKAKVCEAEMGDLKKKLEEMTADKKKQQRMIEGLQKESTEQAEAANELEADNKTRLQRIRELEEELQQRNQEVKLQQSRADRESKKGTSLETTLSEQKEQVQSLQKKIKVQAKSSAAALDELKQKLTKAEDEVADWKSRYKQQQRMTHGLESEATSLREKATSLEESVRRLDAQNEHSEGPQSTAKANLLESSLVEEAMNGTGLEKSVEKQKDEMDALLEEVLAFGDDETSAVAERGASAGYDDLEKEPSHDDLTSLAEELELSKHKYQEQQYGLLSRDGSDKEPLPGDLGRPGGKNNFEFGEHNKVTSRFENDVVVDASDLLEEGCIGGGMNASAISHSEAVVDQFERAWMQQEDNETIISRRFDRLKDRHSSSAASSRSGHKTPPPAPYDEEIDLSGAGASTVGPVGFHIPCSSARRSRRGGSPPPPLTHYKEEHSGNMSPVSPKHLHQKHARHAEGNRSLQRGRNRADKLEVHSADVEDEQDGIGLPGEVLKRLEAINRGEDMDVSFSNSEAIAEQLELAWVQQETGALEPHGIQGEPPTHNPRRHAGSPPPLKPYGEEYSSNISPASPRHVRHQQQRAQHGRRRTKTVGLRGISAEAGERQEHQDLPRDVMKRLNTVHKGDMDVSFSNSEAIAEQFQLTWMQQEGDDTVLFQQQDERSPRSQTLRDGIPSPSPYKEPYISEVSPVTHKNPYQRQNYSALNGPVGHRRGKSDESSYCSEDTERELGDFGPFIEKWSLECKDGEMDSSPYRTSGAASEQEAIYHEMDASCSNSEAIAEQFELAWFQQQDDDIEESPGKGIRSPYSSVVQTSRKRRPRRRKKDKGLNAEETGRFADVERASLRRCNTSELVREHRLRRPSVLVETNEVDADSDSSGSEANQKDWSKPSLCTVGNREEYERSPNRRQKDAAYSAEEMDGSFSNSEAIAEQLELAWFRQQREEESEELIESPYCSPCRTRKLYEDESVGGSGDKFESRGLSNTVMGKLEAIYNEMDASFSDSEAIVEQMERVCFKKQEVEDETEATDPRFDSKGMLVQNPNSKSHPWRKGYEGKNHKNVKRDECTDLPYKAKGEQDTELSPVVQERQLEMIKTLQADNKELLRQLWDLEMNAEKDMEELQRELDARAAKIIELELTCEELKEEKVILVQTSDMLRHLLREAEVMCAKQTASIPSRAPEEKKQD